MASGCTREVYIGYQEIFLHWKGGQALEQAAQRRGAITILMMIPEDIYMWYLGAWFRGEDGSFRLKVGLDDLKGLFQL